jgi:hypothetical protein
VSVLLTGGKARMECWHKVYVSGDDDNDDYDDDELQYD